MEIIKKIRSLNKFYNGINSSLDFGLTKEENDNLKYNNELENFQKFKQDLLKQMNSGVQFDWRYNESCLNDILVYIKDNYEEAVSLFDDIIFMKQNNCFNYLYCALLLKNNSSLNEIFIGKRVRERYSKFFEVLDKNDEKKSDFWNLLDNYLVLMLEIISKTKHLSINMRNEFFDKTIFNLNKVRELGFHIVTFSNSDKCEFNLEYQPRGVSKNIFMSILRYKEENFFTDGEFVDEFDESAKSVNVKVYNPSFVVKSSRLVGFGLTSGNFDNKNKKITIYDLNFDSFLLPSLEELDNTKCGLESYKMLEFVEKCDLFKLKVEEFLEFSNEFDKKLAFLVNLAKELGIEELADIDVDDLFKIDEIKNGINNGIKKLVKK